MNIVKVQKSIFVFAEFPSATKALSFTKSFVNKLYFESSSCNFVFYILKGKIYEIKKSSIRNFK